MNTTDETNPDEVPEETEETEEKVPDRNRQKRVAELKAELADLEGTGPTEDTVDSDAAEVKDAVDEEAEEIANSADSEAEVEAQADDAAEEIAKAAKRQGVTFSDEEIDGIARRIVTRANEIKKEDSNEGGKDETKSEKPGKPAPGRRQPDRRPKSTHFSERRLFGRDRS